jgi:opacity protein-like surface antigen
MVHAENSGGPYVGAGWGRFNLDIRNLSDAGTAASSIAKSNDNAWKGFVGWRFNPYIGVEAAYVDYGRAGDRFTGTGSNGNYRVSVSGFAPALIGTLPLGPVELFAKVGSYFYDVKVKVDFDNPGPGIESKHSRNDFLYGGGVGITFLEHLHVRAEYETVELQNAKNSDALWLSAAWRF